jgi:hypothetical protein
LSGGTYAATFVEATRSQQGRIQELYLSKREEKVGYPDMEGQEFGGLENRLKEVLSRLITSTENHSDDRKIVVRWFNRLVYEISVWNEALLSLLAEYEPQRTAESEDHTESLRERFYSFARAVDRYQRSRPEREELTEEIEPTAFDICDRITFLQKRFTEDFAWLATKDPATYRILLVAINETVDSPGYPHGPRSDLFRKVDELGKAIFEHYDHQTNTQISVNPKEAKHAIAEYRKWSTQLLEQLNRRAREIGVSLLSIRDYEDALRRVGSTDSTLYVIGEVAMSADTYNVGQAGAVGPGATAQEFSMQQVWQQNAERFNLSDLASELGALRSAMRSHASDAEHDIAIGAVAAAEEAAAKGDGPTALAKLKEAGKWSFDVATKIGTSVAAAALKTVLGI